MSYLLFGKYPYLTPLSVNSNESRFISESLNLRRQVVKNNAQRFEFSISVSGGVGNTLHADLMSNWFLKGMETPFTIAVPQPLYTDSLTLAPSQVKVFSITAAGSNEVQVVSTLPHSIPAGRFITFGNHSKLYVITESVTNSSQGTIKVSPRLVSGLPANTVVNVHNVNATVLNEADNSSFAYDSGVIQSANLKFIEYLN